MVVSVFLKINFWHHQISVSKIGIPMSKIAPELLRWFHSDVFIVELEQTLHIVLVILLLALDM